MKALERRQWRHSIVFIVNFEHILYLFLELLLLTMNNELWFMFSGLIYYILSKHDFFVIYHPSSKPYVQRHLWFYQCVKSIYPYSVWMRENTDQKNSEYRHFPRSVRYCN